MNYRHSINFIVALLVGFIAGGIAIYAAWQHNPQLEFHGVGYINFKDLGLIGLSWLLIVALPSVIFLYAFNFLVVFIGKFKIN